MQGPPSPIIVGVYYCRGRVRTPSFKYRGPGGMKVRGSFLPNHSYNFSDPTTGVKTLIAGVKADQDPVP